MIRDFWLSWVTDNFSSLVPHDIDPKILSITITYLAVQFIIFLISTIIYQTSINLRWLQIKYNSWFVARHIKKSEDIKAARQKTRTEIFNRTGWAKDAFNDFRIAWEDARDRNEDTAIMPIRLRDFLTPEIVLDGVRNRRIAEALPGVFVSMGIFGTFLGLVLGLSDLRIDDLANLKQGVGHLLSGLSLAFYTSLLGILLSIIFSILYRWRINSLEKAFLKIDALFCTLFPFQSYERYMRRFYDLQADIKHGLQTLATDVATKIADTMEPAIGEAFQKHLLPVMQDLHSFIKKNLDETREQQSTILEGFNRNLSQMSNVISKHFESSQRKQSEAMETVLKQYVDNMNDTFKSQFNDMGRLIEETTKSQSDIKEQLVEFTNHLKAQFEVQRELIGQTSRAGEILGESLDSLENISQKLKSSADDIASAAALLETSAIKAKEGLDILKDSMERQIDTMTETREELEITWRTTTESAKSVVDYIRETIRELGEGIGENLVQALDAFDGKVAEVVERFSGTLFEASQTIEEIPSLIAYLEKSINLMSSDISNLRSSFDDFNNSTQNLMAANIDKAITATEGIAEGAEKISSAVGATQEIFTDFSEKLRINTENIEEKVSISSKEFGQSLNDAIVELRQTVTFLDKNSPIYKALTDIKNLSSTDITNPEDTTSTIDLTEPIAMINSRLESSVDNNKAILGKVAAIEQNFNRLAGSLPNDIMVHLKAMRESTDKVLDFYETMKSSNVQNGNDTTSKRGFFSRMIKK